MNPKHIISLHETLIFKYVLWKYKNLKLEIYVIQKNGNKIINYRKLTSLYNEVLERGEWFESFDFI